MDYRPTVRACFTGYIVQAVVNNFAPLLFLTFQARYGVPLSQVTLLITINFGLQLLIDTASAFFIIEVSLPFDWLIDRLYSICEGKPVKSKEASGNRGLLCT